jgi:hypothetical protein
MRKAPVLVTLATVAVFVPIVASLVGSAEDEKKPEAAPAGGYKMVAPLDAIMIVMADVYKRMPEQLRTGTAKDVRAVQKEALFVAEVGNLSAQVAEHREKKDWAGWAEDLKVSGLAMAEAAKAKDNGKFEGLHKAALGTCKACHDKYRDE